MRNALFLLLVVALFGTGAVTASHDDSVPLLAVALATTLSRKALIRASHCWRQGLPTIIATNLTDQEANALTAENSKDNERYISIPDEVRNAESGRVHAKRAGDYRAALLPSVAHEVLEGKYHWLLYGDDDTVFFLPGIRKVIRGLDPEQPHAISDNLWLLQKRPSLAAPRCLPCQYQPPPITAFPLSFLFNNTNAPPLTQKAGINELRAEGRAVLRSKHLQQQQQQQQQEEEEGADLLARPPSSPAPNPAWEEGQEKRKSRKKSKKGGGKLDGLDRDKDSPASVKARMEYVPPHGCPHCHPGLACAPYVSAGVQCRWSGAHGGGGVLLSVGLLRLLPRPVMESCLQSQWACSGGDCLLSRCLWLAGNVSYTDPGYSMHHQSAKYVAFDSPLTRSILLSGAVKRLQSGKCNAHCQWALEHVVSVHMGARFYPSLSDVARDVELLCKSYSEFQRFLAEIPA